MKKRNKLLIKLGILCTAFVGLITALVVPTKAYYVDSNGNLASSNLMNPEFINDNSLSITDYHTINDYGLIANTDYTLSFQALAANYFYYRVNWSSDNYTSWVRSDSSLTFNIGSYTEFSIVADRVYDKSLFNLMLNTGSTPLDYEVYGAIYYSQANYNAYGTEQYNEGVNDVYNSLQQQPIAQSSSVSGATLNADMTLYQRITFTNVDSGSDYIDLTWSSVGGKYSSITFSFDSDYYFTNVTLSSFNPPFVSGRLFIEGYDMDINRIDSTWGFYNISSVYSGTARSITINLMSSSSTSITIRFKINSLLSSIADTQTAYNTGYENGYRTAEESYIAEVAQLESANATLQSQINMGTTNANALFWTIASTPFESFKTIWNVDVMGLNISGFVLGVLLALIILYIIKKVW